MHLYSVLLFENFERLAAVQFVIFFYFLLEYLILHIAANIESEKNHQSIQILKWHTKLYTNVTICFKQFVNFALNRVVTIPIYKV